MIIYKDIIGQLKEAGYNTTRLRRERILSESVLSRIRRNDSVSTETIDTICRLLDCQPNGIMEYKEDGE